ncbi:MAG: endolytic transglycosylase MltG, partial [Clostridia bacterium]|nr:endolytic transglycosylase MltG [Clostridia bacterium]
YGLFWYSWLWQILRPLMLALCVCLVVAGVIMSAWNWVDRHFFAPVDAQDTDEVTFVVSSGNSLTRVANNLEEAGLIHNRTVFKYYADFLGYGQKIQAGDYKVSRSMSMQQIMELLTTGDGNPITRNITIIPGWTVRDIAAYLKEQGAIDDENAFLEMCRTGQNFSAYYYVADVLSSPNAFSRLFALEGYLAPDTYEVYTNATPEDIIKKLLSQTEAVFKMEYHDRAEQLGMTMDQIITMASMIEKEAKNADFAKVSAVFHGRLRRNMTLGSDVTVKYATGVKRMALSSADLAVNSPYNTYLYSGLPLGPICSPSAAAIQAALYPDEQFMAEGYLYFCSKDPNTGELHFSRTLEEHELAVSIYAPLWQAFDREKGL